MIRRFGEPVVEGKRYIMRPGAYAILVRGDSLLLTHQSEPEPEFQLPGGGIDPGESAIAALHREVMEETGWKIATPRRLGAFRRFTYMPEYDMWAEKICHIYSAVPGLKHGEPTEPLHQAIWTSATVAAQVLANEGDRYFVDRFIRG
jgi:8-oxo-dGTP diphosphatase